MNQLTRKLYPAIAEKYGTTKHCVERGIRTAIEVSYKKTDKLIYEEYFGKRSNRVAPSEFIATIFYKLKY